MAKRDAGRLWLLLAGQTQHIHSQGQKQLSWAGIRVKWGLCHGGELWQQRRSGLPPGRAREVGSLCQACGLTSGNSCTFLSSQGTTHTSALGGKPWVWSKLPRARQGEGEGPSLHSVDGQSRRAEFYSRSHSPVNTCCEWPHHTPETRDPSPGPSLLLITADSEQSLSSSVIRTREVRALFSPWGKQRRRTDEPI